MLYTDQIGNKLSLAQKPRRIISLVPSQSELLWDLGLQDELVGITKFCVHPAQMFQTVSRVGGTKNLDLGKIRALKPDLIIGNKEENEKGQIEALQKEFPVWMSDIFSFEDALQMMQSLGEILEKQTEARLICERLQTSFLKIKNTVSRSRVLYFIWNKPYMCAAENTFIDHVLSHIGFQNAMEGQQRYPELSEQELRKTDPAICLLSSEPFPFKEEHVQALQKILPHSKIIIVDGEVFSWYGTRLLHLERYIHDVLSPQL